MKCDLRAGGAIATVFFLAMLVVAACSPDPRQETAGTDRFGNASKVKVTCFESGMKVFDMDTDSFDANSITNYGRCIVVKHPKGNVFACGGFCQVVPLE